MKLEWRNTKDVVHEPLICYGGVATIFGFVEVLTNYIFQNNWFYLLLLVLVPAWGYICFRMRWAEEVEVE